MQEKNSQELQNMAGKNSQNNDNNNNLEIGDEEKQKLV